MKCQKCGNEITSSDKYCNNCGAKIEKPAAYYCPKCKKEFDKKLNFCNVCGTKLKIKLETMSCPYCGKTIPKNSVCCPFCYKELNSDIPVSSNKKRTNKPIYKYSKFWIAIIGLVIIIAFFIIMLITEYNINKPVSESVKTHAKSTEVVTEAVTTERRTTESNFAETENTTEKPTEKPTELPTEKPTDITEPMTLLFSDSEISVYYSDTEFSKYFDDRVDIHLFIENNMNKSIEVQADTIVLDGISYNDLICSDPISANSRGMIEITVLDCNVKSPKTVGADLRYFNSDFSGDTVNLNIVSQSVK